MGVVVGVLVLLMFTIHGLGLFDRIVQRRPTAAAVLDAHWSAGLSTGVVLGVPIPAGHEADRAVIDAAIVRGLAAADAAGITGSEATPFLLVHIAEATDGASLDANVALVQENTRVATEVAVALAATR